MTFVAMSVIKNTRKEHKGKRGNNMEKKFRGKLDVLAEDLEEVLSNIYTNYSFGKNPCPVDKNGWVYGSLIDGIAPYIVGVVRELGEELDLTYCYPISNGTACQSTGLKDLYQREIYEGDILKCRLYDGKYENYMVEFENYRDKYGNNAEYVAYNFTRTNFIASNIWEQFPIIGNIHDNPELMEGTK